MTNKSGVFLLFGLIFLTLQPAWSQEADEEVKQLDDEAKKKFVLETMIDELRLAFRTKALRKIDDLERFADLEPGALKKARILSKGAVRDITSEFGGLLFSPVQRSIEEVFGTTFTINGEDYTFEGEVAEAPFLNVQFNFSRSRGNWQVQRPRGSSAGSFGGNRLPFLIENDGNWRKSVEAISDDQLAAYEEFATKRANQQLSLALTASLAHRLRLDAEQKKQMREFLDSRVQHDSDFSMKENLALQLNKSNFESAPEFLTDAQAQRWDLLITNQ